MKVRQLCLEIENQPGRVYEIVQMLSASDVAIIAISVSETGMSGTLRMIVSDLRNARQVLMDHEVPASVEEVLVLHCRQDAGAIADVLRPLHEKRINVHYLYAFPGDTPGQMGLVVGVPDNDRAIEVLIAAGVDASSNDGRGG